MKQMHVQIVTLDGLLFDGPAEKLSARTVMGDVGIRPGHVDYVTTIDAGRCTLTADGNTRSAACTDGFLSVSGDEVRLVATTFEWADAIDVERAEQAYHRASEALKNGDKQSEAAFEVLESKMKRALLRKQVGEQDKL